MKKITLIVALLASSFMFAQTTFDVDWENPQTGAPTTFTVEQGDAVRWTWTDALPHSVTNLAGSTQTFDSGIITGAGTEFTFTFTTVGSNPYECIVHPAGMNGTITVEPVLSVEDKFKINVRLYPNPVEDRLTISSLYHLDSYEIYNMLGKKVGGGLGEGNFTQLETSWLNAGVYFINVTAGDLNTTVKLVKE